MRYTSDSKKYKQIVAHGYDQVSDAYARLESESEWPRISWLTKLLQRLEVGSSLLDLGSGSGDPADIEIAKLHSVTGVDISKVKIQLARRNIPAGTFIHADISSEKHPVSSFHAVFFIYALEHIPRDEHVSILKNIQSWLSTGGYLFVVEHRSRRL